MTVFINKKETSIPTNFTVEDLLKERGIPSYAAVWINGVHILYEAYISARFSDLDQIKIMRITCGG